jgi:hypothetical protein
VVPKRVGAGQGAGFPLLRDGNGAVLDEENGARGPSWAITDSNR